MPSTQTPHFDALLVTHRRSVEGVCRAILRDDDLAADATQETFVRLWARLAREGEPAHCGAWLRRVALTTSLDLARRREARAHAEAEGRIDVGAPAPDSSSPITRAATAELEAHFELALRDLPEGQRTVFLCRHRGGLTLREVAELLGLGLPTTRTQFARAALRLQSRLAHFRNE